MIMIIVGGILNAATKLHVRGCEPSILLKHQGGDINCWLFARSEGYGALPRDRSKVPIVLRTLAIWPWFLVGVQHRARNFLAIAVVALVVRPGDSALEAIRALSEKTERSVGLRRIAWSGQAPSVLTIIIKVDGWLSAIPGDNALEAIDTLAIYTWHFVRVQQVTFYWLTLASSLLSVPCDGSLEAAQTAATVAWMLVGIRDLARGGLAGARDLVAQPSDLMAHVGVSVLARAHQASLLIRVGDVARGGLALTDAFVALPGNFAIKAAGTGAVRSSRAVRIFNRARGQVTLARARVALPSDGALESVGTLSANSRNAVAVGDQTLGSDANSHSFILVPLDKASEGSLACTS